MMRNLARGHEIQFKRHELVLKKRVTVVMREALRDERGVAQIDISWSMSSAWYSYDKSVETKLDRKADNAVASR